MENSDNLPPDNNSNQKCREEEDTGRGHVNRVGTVEAYLVPPYQTREKETSSRHRQWLTG
jgi:hypothetical protein